MAPVSIAAEVFALSLMVKSNVALLKFGKHSPYCALSPHPHYDSVPEDCTCGFTETLKSLGLDHPEMVGRGSVTIPKPMPICS